ncbi:YhcN/YlaJ family sporulation lipoprotein [Brevibacillus humidisoli]|uniref:YhcN/YlaJ family sporulation lipoprotein n=1 Tax=Brevibacillus humidisoli TaxID=2895522 RepID=UPI001E449B08|nr:YhcN/YlaJ family sporulation lipoprotein [Brevibacillus humidisoli]UFJ41875.1 YhcN/YlaJ family sporulation lipoprotein [Brevibacillus humidisoli]
MKKWLYPLSCLALVSMLAACGTNNAAGPNADGQNPTINQTRPFGNNTFGYNTYGNNTFGYNTFNDGMDGLNATPGVYDRNLRGGTAFNRNNFGANGMAARNDFAFNRQKADQLARVADDVAGVDGATAIVRGNDAVIGVNSRLTANNPRQRQSLERRVQAAVRSVDPTLNVRVTSDRNMLSRIRNMDQNMRNNNNINGSVTTGPTTVGGNLANAGEDFNALLRDLGRTVTAPFR